MDFLRECVISVTRILKNWLEASIRSFRQSGSDKESDQCAATASFKASPTTFQNIMHRLSLCTANHCFSFVTK